MSMANVAEAAAAASTVEEEEEEEEAKAKALETEGKREERMKEKCHLPDRKPN